MKTRCMDIWRMCLWAFFILPVCPFLISGFADNDSSPTGVSLGYVTDIHHNDVGRRAGDCVEALQEVIAFFDTLPLSFLVHGGDFLDRNTGDPETELNRIERVFQSGVHKGYHVLGNHDYDVPGGVEWPKEWFIEITSMPDEYYYRDYGHVRFLFLNSNAEARTDAQIRWLENTIRETDRPVVVFAHHSIGGDAGHIRIFQEILGQYGDRVIASITAHHSAVTNTVNEIDGVLYYSMAHFFHQVPTYAVITIGGECGLEINIEGFGRQVSFRGAQRIDEPALAP